MFVLKQKNNQFVKKYFWLLFGLIFFFLPLAKVDASEFSVLVAPPQITSLVENQTLSGKISVTGISLNYSQTKIYIDENFIGSAVAEIGSLGWQEFFLSLPTDLSYGTHQLSAVSEYFNHTRSATTTLNFNYQPKLVGPTLFNPVLNSETNFQQPWIVGVTPNNSLVEFYLDKMLDGQTQTGAHPSGIIDFKYQPGKKLAPGFHVVQARVVGSNGQMSDFSNEIIFEIRANKQILSAPNLPEIPEKFIPPVPAPTLLEPKSGLVTTECQFTLSGVVHNEHYVKIYIDGNLAGEFMPISDKSGVASFVWPAPELLAVGSHQIWAENINPRGQTSGNSNVLQIIILPPEPIFVSNASGKIASASISEPAADIQPENIVDEELPGTEERIKNWFDHWQYAFEFVIFAILASIIIWFWNNRKRKNNNEKIEIKVKDKVEDFQVSQNNPVEEIHKVPIIEGPEISYDKIETAPDENDKFIPPANMPTLGI